MSTRYFTPGPSQLHPAAIAHIPKALELGIASISHRAPAFVEMYGQTTSALRQLLQVPEDYEVYFLGSANEAWERLAQNCIRQHSFHLVNGNFSSRFREYVDLCQKQTSVHQVPFGQGFELSEISVNAEAELIAVVANETSSGVWTPPELIYELAGRHPDKLVVVDAVSAYPAYPLDLSRVDGAYFSVQKGFGLPAGLGVLISSPRLRARAAELEAEGFSTGSYHRFANLQKYADRNQTPETPNALAIYLLGRVAEAMLAQGPALRTSHLAKMARLYEFFENFEGLRPFVPAEKFRSQTVMVLEADGQAQKWIDQLAAAGFVIGAGYGSYKTTHLRIANFPAMDMADVEALLAAF